MQSLEVSGAVRPIYVSLGVKWLIMFWITSTLHALFLLISKLHWIYFGHSL